jgi:membrane dipeptidase
MLDVLHAAGLRSLGPVWSRPNLFGDGVPFRFPSSPDIGGGLTDLGRELVRRCNHLNILVDLSHLTEQGFWDVAKVTDAPLVASHSNAHAVCPHSRNLTDRQLAAIRESGGLAGVNLATGFLRADGRRDADTPLADVVRHVDHLVEHLGIDGVGIGSDFDGATVPAPIADAAGLPELIAALRQRGYDEPSLRKIAHENWLRVLERTWA